jgi:hypothetical protein
MDARHREDTMTDAFKDCTCGQRIYRAVNGSWYHWVCGAPVPACTPAARTTKQDVDQAQAAWEAAEQAGKEARDAEQAAWDHYMRLSGEFLGSVSPADPVSSFAAHTAASIDAIAEASR